MKQKTKQIELKAFAKINLTLDVLGTLDNGFHEVSMIMQQILLCDDVRVQWIPSASQTIDIRLSTNRNYLPTDAGNLAHKAAAAMISKFGKNRFGTIRIDIKKRIPVAAGLAGGSSNAAAVLHGLRKLWNLELSLKELCEIGQSMGSDIPFCIMGQAAANEILKQDFQADPLACHCALATGTGTDLTPIAGLRSHLVLSKPPISVSTAEVYQGIDNEVIDRHPDNAEMIQALEKNNTRSISKNMVNVLENYTLKRYPIVMYTKDKMLRLCRSGCVLMSGSGPTVFGLCNSIAESKEICQELLTENKESFWTRTTW